jgi:hypothetical protein
MVGKQVVQILLHQKLNVIDMSFGKTQLIIYILSVSCLSCASQKTALTTAQNTETKIVLAGFPSNDTLALTFYKNNGWFIERKIRDAGVAKNITLPCLNCDEIITPSFIEALSKIHTEEISAGCRLTKDTVIEHRQPLSRIFMPSPIW